MRTALRLLIFQSCFSLLDAAIAAEPHHFFRFTSGTPGNGRTGTLTYSRGDVAITGPVLFRTSYYGDFLLLFTDKSGKRLVQLQQDRSYARIQGQLVGTPWEGEIRFAPANLRGWLSLGPSFVDQVVPLSVRKVTGDEKFQFYFARRARIGHLGF
jgi:hypothetical protein